MLPDSWVVVVEIDQPHHPALAFAAWLWRRASRFHDAPRFVGAFVLAADSELARSADPDATIQLHIDALLHHYGAYVDQRFVLRPMPDHEGLLQLALPAHPPRGLIVARAPSLVGWLRPGPVRKLFHDAPAPLVIVPPDYEPAEGDETGPVVIATGHDDSSHRAERSGRDLAARLGLDAMTVQVGPAGVEPTSIYDGEPDRLQHGPTVAALEQAARDTDAALFVCGTRGLSGWERWLLSSVSTNLAARADRPVLVIPPPDVVMRAAGNG